MAPRWSEFSTEFQRIFASTLLPSTTRWRGVRVDMDAERV